DVARAMAREARRDRADGQCVEKNPDLHGPGGKGREDGVEVPGHEWRGEGLDPENPYGVLRGRGREDGGAVDAVRGERQQVGLDAGASARVRGGDRHGRQRALAHRISISWRTSWFRCASRPKRRSAFEGKRTSRAPCCPGGTCWAAEAAALAS